jgi:DinB superfamily
MSPRAEALARSFEDTNADFMRFMAGLTDEEWAQHCPNEERSVAALGFHVAGAYLFEIRAFQGIADDQPLPTVEKEWLDRLNAENGAKNARAGRDAVLAALEENGATAAEWVRGLTDEQLERAGAYVDWIEPMSLELWIEHVLIGHIVGHRASIEAVVSAKPAGDAD